MKVAAVVFGLALFGGLIVLAVAGVSGATAVLVTGGAVVAMIGLGNAVGGRQTPSRPPLGAVPGEVTGQAPDEVTGAGPDEVTDIEPDGAEHGGAPER